MREKIRLNDNWSFRKEGEQTEKKVVLPHTWNSSDCFDGNETYQRTRGYYTRMLHIPGEWEGKRIFLQFEGACQRTYMSVGGRKLPFVHDGGFGRFRFDVTDYVEYGKDNFIEITVSNEIVSEIAPLDGDFNCQGGLYRDVFLVVTDKVHFHMLDDGSDGIYLTPQKVTSVRDGRNQDFYLKLKAGIINDDSCKKRISVRAALRHPAEWEPFDNEYISRYLRFNPEEMYVEGGAEAGRFREENLEAEAGAVCWYEDEITVKAPRLWDGLRFPYLYEVEISIWVDGKMVDSLTRKTGFRYYEIPAPGADKAGGKFFLNGREYVLRGACKHQDKGAGEEARGFAVTRADLIEDAAVMYELGMNAVRLVHYQHSEAEIELYDRLGIVVWAELGLVGSILSKESPHYQGFLETTKGQLREMIKQQYNHPSVVVWSLSNEVRRENLDADTTIEESDMKVPSAGEFFKALNEEAKELDKTRYTTYALFSVFGRKKDWASDTYAINLYPYWYKLESLHGGNASMTGQVMYNFGLTDGEGNLKPMGISEYGASAVEGMELPIQEDGTVKRPESWQICSGTYQAYCHEKVYREIVEELPFLWCSFVWQLFDSASYKKMNILKGINDKGLVEINHRTKKDAFYFYKANWNEVEPFVHVVKQGKDDNTGIVRAYSNGKLLQLYLDGVPFGELTGDRNSRDAVADGLHIFRWYGVPTRGKKVEIKIIVQ